MIHNLLVLGRYDFSVAVPGLSHSDMQACQLPGTGMMTGSYSGLIDTLFLKCVQRRTHQMQIE